MSDGDLFFVIRNGVRWTGMPGWKREHTPDETWKLVSFIRHVPLATAHDLNATSDDSKGAHSHR